MPFNRWERYPILFFVVCVHMKKDVLISIKGTYTGEETSDSLDLTTVGNFYRRNDSYYIRYQESEATGYEGCTTTVRVEADQRVTISRSGKAKSQLILEKQRRHLCHYDTGMGAFTVGVFPNLIESDLTDQGGAVHFRYTLDINSSFASKNDVVIQVRVSEAPQVRES